MNGRALFVLTVGAITCATAFAQSSRWMNYEARVEFSGRAPNVAEWNSWRAAVVGADGKERYVLEKRIPFDVPPPAIIVSDADGSSIVLLSFEGSVEFYDGGGKILHIWHPFVSSRPDYERTVQSSVAGRRAAFLIAEPGVQGARVVLCGSRGEQLWERLLPFVVGGSILLSDSADLILACAYTVAESLRAASVIFNAAGDEVQRLPEIFTSADISSDGKKFVMVQRRKLILGLVGSPGEVRTWNVADSTRALTSVCFSEGGVAVVGERFEVGNAGPVFRDPAILVYGENGSLIHAKEFEGTSPRPARLMRRGAKMVMSWAGEQVALDSALSK